MIIIGTGSRDFRFQDFIHNVLNSLYVRHPAITDLYHGACQYTSGPHKGKLRGADRYLDEWGNSVHGIEVHRRYADWDRHGKAAGPIRNDAMVKEAFLKANCDPTQIICVAFPLSDIREKSKGTWNAVDCAERLKIPTDVYTQEDVVRMRATRKGNA